MPRLVLFSMVVLSACASTYAEQLTILSSSSTPVQGAILSNYNGLFRINASIGDPETFIVTDESLLETYRTIIAPRFWQDLIRVHGSASEAAATYMLLAEQSDSYLVFIIRVTNIRENGAYSPLPGLMYRFKKDNNEFVGVNSTVY